MARQIDALSAEALVLPPKERIALAHLLLSSVEPSTDDQADQAWEQEIKLRMERHRAGQSKTVDAETVFARLREIAP
jgi:putative addiction module component (TIGR02574 family)